MSVFPKVSLSERSKRELFPIRCRRALPFEIKITTKLSFGTVDSVSGSARRTPRVMPPESVASQGGHNRTKIFSKS